MALKFLNDGYFAGKVGIGTESPSSKLSIYDSAFSDTAGTGIIELGTGSTKYWNFRLASTAAADLVIDRTYSGTSSEVFRVQRSTGNVGIGTAVPNAKLEVNSAITFSTIDTFGQLVVKAASGSTGDMLNIGVDTANSVAFIQANDRGVGTIPLSLQRYGGNVGIGTDDPQNPLHIKKEGYQLKLEDGNTTNTCEILASNNTMGFFSDRANAIASSDMIFSIDNDTKMVIDTNGNVGIGTDNPAKKLTVATDTVNDGVYITTSGGTNVARIGTSSTATSGALALLAGGSTKVFISAKANENSYFNGGGNVGIGTTTPGEPLTVKTKTAAYFPGIKIEDYDSSMGLYVQNIEGGNSGIGTGRYYNSSLWRSDVTAPTAIRLDEGVIRFYAQSGVTANANYTPTERMRISSAGAIKFNAYNSGNNTGTPIFLLGTDNSGNVVKTNTVPGSGAGPYLPLSAGSSYPLTGDLYISKPTNGSDAIINLTSKSAAGNSRTSSIEYDADTEFMYFKNAGTTVATMTSAGNVGIGTTSPGAKLEVSGSLFFRDFVRGYVGTGTTQYVGATWLNASDGVFYVRSADVDKVVLNSNGDSYFNGGNVGIGVTGPASKLHIAASGNLAIPTLLLH